ncbi:hypothetical protein OCUBac02_22460 [Bosea sp. ANAM02]|nr:hypothetical protein OCUBac02_22460 [Bosea sp. ANAM02]
MIEARTRIGQPSDARLRPEGGECVADLYAVAPGDRRETRNPFRSEFDWVQEWIPDLRFAPSGMTRVS